MSGTYPNPEIGTAKVTSAKIANWDGQEDSTTGITTEHLRNGAVTPDKLAPDIQFQVTGSATGDLDGQYPALTIRDGAVTSNKLSLIAILEEGSLDGRPDEVTVMAEPNAIIQVIPTSEGELSWTSKVKKASSSANQLEYTITITNNGQEAVQYQIRKINLGLLLRQSQ